MFCEGCKLLKQSHAAITRGSFLTWTKTPNWDIDFVGNLTVPTVHEENTGMGAKLYKLQCHEEALAWETGLEERREDIWK